MKKIASLLLLVFCFTTTFSQNIDDYIKRGVNKFNSKDYQGATAEFESALKLNPNSAEANYNLGNVKLELGDTKAAVALYSKAIKASSKSIELYLNRGFAYMKMSDYKSAISDFSKAIEIKPTDYNGYFNRGVAKNKSGDKTGACKDWTKAASLGDKGAEELVKKNCGSQDKAQEGK